MAKFRGERDAFGQPGIEPRWTQGCKEGVGTAYSADSRVWFTIWNGFDQIPAVAARYLAADRKCRRLEIWKPNRQPGTVGRGSTLRIQSPDAFRLHWTRDEWQSAADTVSSPTALGIEFVDIPIPVDQRAPIRFTFFWTQANRWEGRDYEVAVVGEPA